MSYDSKNPLVQGRRLKTQRLCLPFSVTGNAVPASKVITRDDPALLYLGMEGLNGLTVAAGAFDSSAEQSAITFATATDSTGVFSLLVRVSEPVGKVLLARLSKVGADENVNGTFPTGATLGISSVGDKIVLNVDSATDFSVAATSSWCLELEYQVSE